MRCSLTSLAALATFALSLLPAPGLAQPTDPLAGSVFDGDHLTVGMGVIYAPSYDGSDDYVFSPFPGVQGSLGGVAISTRPGGLALDLVPDAKSARLDLALGPVATLSRNRASQIKDPVVRAAGKLDAAVEVGFNAGLTLNRVFNAHDSVTLSADAKRDIAGAYAGWTVSPAIRYAAPLSRAAIVALSVSARHVDGRYADYYYSVSPAQATASGLPQFRARGGWESWSVGGLGGYDLSGNALDGGLAVIVLAAYSRMINAAAATPYTAIRGTPGQWTLGAGLAYTF